MCEESRTPIFFPEMKLLDYARSSRLLKGRSYARVGPFTTEKFDELLTIQDLASPVSKTKFFDRFWVSSWYRLIIFCASWFSFPYATEIIRQVIDYRIVDGSRVADFVDVSADIGSFFPAISLIYGKMESFDC